MTVSSNIFSKATIEICLFVELQLAIIIIFSVSEIPKHNLMDFEKLTRYLMGITNLFG